MNVTWDHHVFGAVSAFPEPKGRVGQGWNNRAREDEWAHMRPLLGPYSAQRPQSVNCLRWVTRLGPAILWLANQLMAVGGAAHI